MAYKKMQKIFYFTDESRKLFIEETMQRKAVVRNISVSALIEDTLMESLLPQHKQARFIIQYYLCGENAVKNALQSVFQYNSAGIGFKADYMNYKPFLDFAISKCSNAYFPKKNEPHLTHFFSEFECVVGRIEELSEYCVDISKRKLYKLRAAHARSMYEAAVQDHRNLNFKNLLYLINDCWDMLEDLTFTYRLLADIAEVNEKWDESDIAREELYQLIVEASKQWEVDDNARNI